MKPVDIRTKLVEALHLDLIGPGRSWGKPDEVLEQAPSRWYLTGFLVPLEGEESDRYDAESDDELDGLAASEGSDDDTPPEPAPARRAPLPSAIGLSLLVAKGAKQLTVTVRWGDYAVEEPPLKGERVAELWKRTDRKEQVVFDLPEALKRPKEKAVPGSGGLWVVFSVRPVHSDGAECEIPTGTRAVSVFLVNRRKVEPDVVRDVGHAFQAELEVTCDRPLVARPNLRSLESGDWDERVADLQYRDVGEYAVGHSVATHALLDEQGQCRTVRTCWIPEAQVERVAPREIKGVELSMDALGKLSSGEEAQAKLGSFVTQYRAWIEEQRLAAPKSPKRRKDVAEELLNKAIVASARIEAGIKLLADRECREAFTLANRAMSTATRRRLGVIAGKDPETITPAWRPFQLAFILMNLPGIADPAHNDRGVVDLLFFPTGGGKTEAYLGLAAFTLVLRRLRNKGIASAGLSVLMRYTLRLLTLDQLGRAATLICALELERQNDVEKLGEWPFEIGLWVGKGATPNEMGQLNDGKKETARARTIAYGNRTTSVPPIPIEECPWCGTKLNEKSFHLVPNRDYPTDLRVNCSNRDCEFTRGKFLPILAVDEPIYRRLPCFMIATVDKFAAMPWTGQVGGFFGRVDRYDREGFFGPCEPGRGQALPVERLLPPDLVIQDELHLISGPLGTMVGLYEAALDELCGREQDGKKIRPKIIASTATVRRADNQIRALFNRSFVDIFPPPGPDRRNSFYAETHSPSQSNARLYVGVAAQGRSAKVVMLRTYLAMLGAAQKLYEAVAKKVEDNPVDPYMTLLGYFNALRELGGARRVIEDEISSRVRGYSTRKRVGEVEGTFSDRKIASDVMELTSRVTTDKVALAKRRLALPFTDTKERVDVAIATNMISVGLDIVRLGLMVVFGQPKTSAEYIQATSRVGRDPMRPGLVITILNIHKPRDRSHYERFCAYHESFYRNVEATSVTPFSPRALDRGLAGTLVALARQGHAPMTPARGAAEILKQYPNLDFVADRLSERARNHDNRPAEEADKLRQRVRERSKDLLDEWSKIAKEMHDVGDPLQYQKEVGGSSRLLFEFLSPELRGLPERRRKFRANRSMRDVEPSVNLWVKTIDGTDVEEEDEP